MPTFYDRATVRNLLKTRLETNITDFQAVYASQPLDLRTQSPVCIIESDGAEYTYRHNENKFWYTVTIGVRRDATDAVEDTLDDLMRQVADNVIGWRNFVMIDRSSVSTVLYGDKTYRIETFSIMTNYLGV